MKVLLTAFASGLMFALGLGLAGMTRPSKVISFLDLAGNWDPSLMLVMIGGISVFAAAYWVMQRRSHSLLGAPLRIPPHRKIDRPLIIGAILFGLGWGLGGFCPGPGIVGMAGQAPEALFFVLAMIAGQLLQVQISRNSIASKKHAAQAAEL